MIDNDLCKFWIVWIIVLDFYEFLKKFPRFNRFWGFEILVDLFDDIILFFIRKMREEIFCCLLDCVF